MSVHSRLNLSHVFYQLDVVNLLKTSFKNEFKPVVIKIKCVVHVNFKKLNFLEKRDLCLTVTFSKDEKLILLRESLYVHCK